jgi:hypothetical protein
VRTFFILAHEPAEARHIGCKDGSHSALNAIHDHTSSRGTPFDTLYPAAVHGKGCTN